MSSEDLEKFETDLELALYREYRDVLPMFRYVVETDRRFYLCNRYELIRQTGPTGSTGSTGPTGPTGPTGTEGTWFELILDDAWVWDVYRPARFVSRVRVVTFRDVNIEELPEPEAPTR